jgi:putative endonuclease
MAAHLRRKLTIKKSLYRKTLGKQGEKQAQKFLIKQGYQLIVSNYRNCFGEIDIIAQDKEDLVFIEVKTRTNNNFGTPPEAINSFKQQKLTKIAKGYLKENNLEDCCCRFDAVCIEIKQAKPKIELIKNVF